MFFDLGNVYVLSEASEFMGKDFLRHFTVHQKYMENLIVNQMFEIYKKLILEQSDEIFGVNTIKWEDSTWKQLSLVNDEEVISLSHAKVHVFSDSVLCLGKVNQNPASKTVWEEQLSCSKIHHNTELWTQLTENRWNLSGTFSQDSPHYSSFQKFMNKMGEPAQFQGRIIFMSMFNDIEW